MDKTTALVIGFGILALAFIAFFAVFRSKGKGKIKGPFGMGMEVEGSNETRSSPGVQIKNASAGGNLRATDATGRGVNAKNVNAQGDVEISSSGGLPPKI